MLGKNELPDGSVVYYLMPIPPEEAIKVVACPKHGAEEMRVLSEWDLPITTEKGRVVEIWCESCRTEEIGAQLTC